MQYLNVCVCVLQKELEDKCDEFADDGGAPSSEVDDVDTAAAA